MLASPLGHPTEEGLENKRHDLIANFWWLELGGEGDTIHDTEALRHELLKIVLGIWAYMKTTDTTV